MRGSACSSAGGRSLPHSVAHSCARRCFVYWVYWHSPQRRGATPSWVPRPQGPTDFTLLNWNAAAWLRPAPANVSTSGATTTIAVFAGWPALLGSTAARELASPTARAARRIAEGRAVSRKATHSTAAGVSSPAAWVRSATMGSAPRPAAVCSAQREAYNNASISIGTPTTAVRAAHRARKVRNAQAVCASPAVRSAAHAAVTSAWICAPQQRTAVTAIRCVLAALPAWTGRAAEPMTAWAESVNVRRVSSTAGEFAWTPPAIPSTVGLAGRNAPKASPARAGRALAPPG